MHRLLLLLVLLAAGCREGVPAFSPAERTTGEPPYALTFGPGQDADPHWSRNGDTIFYHTTSFHTLPQSNGTLLGVPLVGGAAAPIFPELNDIGRPLAVPVFSPDGNRVAYMDMLSVDAPDACSDVVPDQSICGLIQPLLDSAMLRVRTIGVTGDPMADPHVSVRFAGTDAAHRFAQPGPWIEHLFPFQAVYLSDHAMYFRPTWAPDGERIAFSDGLSLRIWRIGEPTTTVVPNTDDGVSAAWSPDGEWIAFTLIERVDSTLVQCSCGEAGMQTLRTIYTTAPPEIVLVRPDGSERIGLGEGSEPAWSPDGASIYFRRGSMIVRYALDSGEAVPIPGSDFGRSPAVSPNGAWLAFSRIKPTPALDYDIWVVDIQQ